MTNTENCWKSVGTLSEKVSSTKIIRKSFKELYFEHYMVNHDYAHVAAAPISPSGGGSG